MGTRDGFSTMDIQVATNGYICHVGRLVKLIPDDTHKDDSKYDNIDWEQRAFDLATKIYIADMANSCTISDMESATHNACLFIREYRKHFKDINVYATV